MYYLFIYLFIYYYYYFIYFSFISITKNWFLKLFSYK